MSTIGKTEKNIIFIAIALLVVLQIYFHGATYISGAGDFVRIWKGILNMAGYVLFNAH
ncbi:MAG: hypothetical protein HQL01_03930 [Nitrospirae bacterium]|nr:hypothetical protein [Nitrospirota bacterium]